MTESEFKKLVLAGRVFSLARGQWMKLDALAPPPVRVVRRELVETDFASEVQPSDLQELFGPETDYTETVLLVLRSAVMDEVPFHFESGLSMQEVFETSVSIFNAIAPKPIVRRLMVLSLLDKAFSDVTSKVEVAANYKADWRMLREGMMAVSRNSDRVRAVGQRYTPRQELTAETVAILTGVMPVREISLTEDE